MRRDADCRHSRAQAPVEIVFVVLTTLCCLVPLYGIFGGEEPAPRLDEEGLYGEILATRLVEDCRSWDWSRLEEAEGKVADRCLDEVFRDDKKDDWYIAFKEYRRKLGVGKDSFRAKRMIRKIAEGLMAIEVDLAWGQGKAEKHFALFCLRRRSHEPMMARREARP